MWHRIWLTTEGESERRMSKRSESNNGQPNRWDHWCLDASIIVPYTGFSSLFFSCYGILNWILEMQLLNTCAFAMRRIDLLSITLDCRWPNVRMKGIWKLKAKKWMQTNEKAWIRKIFFLCTVGYLSATTATASKEKSNSNRNGSKNCKHGSLKEN